MNAMQSRAGEIGVRQWLAAREPAPPPALASRLRRIAGDATCASPAELPAALLACAARVLATLGDERESAGDLLAADALVTYALEAAAEDCASLDAVAEHAMDILSRADGGEAPGE